MYMIDSDWCNLVVMELNGSGFVVFFLRLFNWGYNFR